MHLDIKNGTDGHNEIKKTQQWQPFQLTHKESLRFRQLFEQLFKLLEPLFVGWHRRLRCCEALCLNVRALTEEQFTLMTRGL